MRVKVRLYRPHDMDLIALKRSNAYKIGTEMKRCLIAYANGTVYTPPTFEFSNDNRDGYVGKAYQIHLELSPKKPEEKAAIDVLQEIRPGFRCAFIKTLFRSNCPYLPLLVFADENGLVTSKIEAFYNKKSTERKTQVDEPQENETQQEEAKEILQEDPVSKLVVEAPKATDASGSDDFDALFAGFDALGH